MSIDITDRAVLLPTPVEYVTQASLTQFGRVVRPELRATLTSVTITAITWDFELKQIRARVLELPGELILWEGIEFNASRNPEQMRNRLVQVLSG